MLFFSACFNNSCYTVQSMHQQLMCHPSTSTDEWCPTACTLCLFSLPCKKSVGGKLQLRSKQISKAPSQENFLTIGSYFEHNM